MPAGGEDGDPAPRLDLPRIFPWLAPTRVSAEGVTTTPQDVDELQQYWGMPRRIRLDFEPNVDRRACDLTGIIDDVIVCTYRTTTARSELRRMEASALAPLPAKNHSGMAALAWPAGPRRLPSLGRTRCLR